MGTGEDCEEIRTLRHALYRAHHAVRSAKGYPTEASEAVDAIIQAVGLPSQRDKPWPPADSAWD